VRVQLCKAILFIALFYPSLSCAEYIDNNDGTISDTRMRLIWQKNTAPGIYNWYDANTYCENLVLADYTDWRLPNHIELSHLVDTSFSPAINTQFFPDTMASGYWSSTEYSDFPYRVYFIDFSDGSEATNIKSHVGYYVRAVRDESCIATYLLGAEDPRLCPLRKFRDYKLNSSLSGRKIINIYYEKSQNIIDMCEKNPAVKRFFKNILERIIPAIEVLM